MTINPLALPGQSTQTAAKTSPQQNPATQINQTCPRNDQEPDCESYLHAPQAAREYADIARYIYFNAMENSLSSGKPNVTVAVTRVRLNDAIQNPFNLCREVVAISTSLGDPGPSAIQRWNQSFVVFSALAIKRGAIYNQNASLFSGGSAPSPGLPVPGHAESNLYNLIGGRGILRAMGISRAPCENATGTDCNTWLKTSLPYVKVAYYNELINTITDF